MKKLCFAFTLALTLQSLVAQELLPREEALRIAFAASLDLNQLQGTPIPTDVDLKRPIVVRDGEYGGLFLPEAKLNDQAIATAGEKIVPVGQLWLHKLTPVADSQAVSSDKLRMASVYLEGDQARVAQCTLGVRRTSGGKLEMLLLGKTPQPLVAVPLTATQAGSPEPLSVSVERDYSGGTATVVLFGKFKAELAFTELED